MRVLCRPAFKINSRRARLHGRGFNNGCCCRRTGPHQWRVSGFFRALFCFHRALVGGSRTATTRDLLLLRWLPFLGRFSLFPFAFLFFVLRVGSAPAAAAARAARRQTLLWSPFFTLGFVHRVDSLLFLIPSVASVHLLLFLFLFFLLSTLASLFVKVKSGAVARAARSPDWLQGKQFHATFSKWPLLLLLLVLQ